MRMYTTAYTIDPETAEDIFMQVLYNILVQKDIAYNIANWRAWSHIGVINGTKIIVNFVSVR